MKIAILVYPGVGLYAYYGLAEPLQKLIPEWVEGVETVSIAGLAGDIPGLPSAAAVSAPGNYAAIIIPAPAEKVNRLQDPAILAWLAGATTVPVRAGLGEGAAAFQAAGITPNDILSAATGDPLDLALKVCERLCGADACRWLEGEYGRTVVPVLEPRRAQAIRETRETAVRVDLDLDGSGRAEIETGLPFFDHMLTQVAVHGLFDLNIQARGDLEIDPHHTVEDVGLALGRAFDQALGQRKGLVRMGSASVPMDESLASVVIDLSGRPYAVLRVDWFGPAVGGLPVTLVEHFFELFAVQARCNLHVNLLAGRDDHHRAEAIFKAFARALDAATRLDPRRAGSMPSSKGSL